MKKLFFFAMLMATAGFSFASNRKHKSKKNVSSLSHSLTFPVSGINSHIAGFWGDERDGGARSHKGIDIFAKKGTPVVAICDGVVVDKGEGGRGGKVVWLQSSTHPWRAYYAHLDKQLVHEGEHVKKGQVLGTVGNTGNAKTTPSHLHFGIYTNNGAVNPLPYVKHSPKVSVTKSTKAKTKISHHKN